jgi:hypothetical protein
LKAISEAARERTMAEHTSARRALDLERALEEAASGEAAPEPVLAGAEEKQTQEKQLCGE